MKILTIAQMRQIEQDCANIGLPPDKLMENAGKAFAEEARKILGDIKDQAILILVGPGKNGGDGLIAARHLHDWGAKVSLFIFGERDTGESNFTMVQECGIDFLSLSEDEDLDKLTARLPETSAIIDALFGIGRIRPFQGPLKKALDVISHAKRSQPALRIIALEVTCMAADAKDVSKSLFDPDSTQPSWY